MALYGLANNIRVFREKRERTQLQVAEAIGVDASTIARYNLRQMGIFACDED